MVKHDIKIIKDICPKMLGSYEEAIKYGEKYLLSYGITENKYRHSHFSLTASTRLLTLRKNTKT